jgi:nucleoside-diphosphate-sugar epimerase
VKEILMKALLTGATGLIGRELVGRLESAVVLSRDPEQARRRLPGVEAHTWAPEAERTGYAFKHRELAGALTAVLTGATRPEAA